MTAPAGLAIGSYSASGWAVDAIGDSVPWSFTLKVTRAPTILEAAPEKGGLTSITFSATLSTLGGAMGAGQPVNFSIPAGYSTCTGVTNAGGMARCTVYGLFLIAEYSTYQVVYAGTRSTSPLRPRGPSGRAQGAQRGAPEGPAPGGGPRRGAFVRQGRPGATGSAAR